MHDMKPCPFCGNPKVKLMKKTHNYTSSYDGRCIYYIKYSARCNVCHARGPVISGLVANYDNCENNVLMSFRARAKIATDKELQAKAIGLWNERIDNGDKESV